MTPRPSPDLDLRRDQVAQAARTIAESEGWAAVTMRRLATGLGVTQPVLYTAFSSRQALIDAVAIGGFADLARALGAVDPLPRPRMQAYLDFALANPRVYEAMFSEPSELHFAADDTPGPLLAAFSAVRDAFPGAGQVHAEVAWAALHGLATLRASGRLPANRAQARFDLLHRMLTQQKTD